MRARQGTGQLPTIRRSVLVASAVAAVASGTVISPQLVAAVNDSGQVVSTIRDTVGAVGQTISGDTTGSSRGGQQASPSSYTVVAGDTMRAIAARFGLSTRALIAANPVPNPDLIFPGQKLTIPSQETANNEGVEVTTLEAAADLVIQVKRGDTIGNLAAKYGVKSSAIVAANGIANPDLIIVGQKLAIPGASAAEIVQVAQIEEDAQRGNPAPQAEPVVKEEAAPPPVEKEEAPPPQPARQRQEEPAPEPAQATGAFVWPTKGVITQRYGPTNFWMEPAYQGHAHFHQGLDLGNKMYTPIVAADGGTVTHAGWSNSGYGFYVQIDHGNGLVTLYGHMAEQPSVAVGQKVGPGQQIGRMGSTGASTGPHLHFAVKQNGAWADPMKFLP